MTPEQIRQRALENLAQSDKQAQDALEAKLKAAREQAAKQKAEQEAAQRAQAEAKRAEQAQREADKAAAKLQILKDKAQREWQNAGGAPDAFESAWENGLRDRLLQDSVMDALKTPHKLDF